MYALVPVASIRIRALECIETLFTEISATSHKIDDAHTFQDDIFIRRVASTAIIVIQPIENVIEIKYTIFAVSMSPIEKAPVLKSGSSAKILSAKRVGT